MGRRVEVLTVASTRPAAPAAAIFGLTRRLRRVVQVALAAIALTGAIWLLAEYTPDLLARDERQAITAKAWSLKFHGAASMVVLVCFGWVLAAHVGLAWRARRHRVSGAALVGTVLVLAISGYFLYYSADDGVREWSSLLHQITGVAAAMVGAVHLIQAKWHGRKGAQT
jgi:negative regulator of sigma E activity